jgi:hypothetical protein
MCARAPHRGGTNGEERGVRGGSGRGARRKNLGLWFVSSLLSQSAAFLHNKNNLIAAEHVRVSRLQYLEQDLL